MTIMMPTSDRSSQQNSLMDHKIPYPRAVIFIAVTEFCERFSYYGMRAVLTIYMRNVLNFSENLSTTIYHVFLLLCYALPVLGGILADSFIGKYRTIFYISVVYAIGNAILSISSVTPFHLPRVPLCLLGLFLMAVGTGGIKPCVVALGGEQFVMPYQEKQLRQFFSVFMFAVSVGNMLSTVVTPVFRRDVSCFGDDTCYPLAFGVPASLMLVAIVVFVCGKKRYTMVEPDGNIMVKVVKCITYAIKEKSKEKKSGKKHEKKAHWLDYATNRFDLALINDTKGLLRVLVYYVPIPMFYALYEQLGSRWTLQATRMDGYVWGYTIKPDQMQVANAILMFIFIPFFEAAVYPVFRKCGLFKRPLQRMVVGGVLAALSFLVAGIIESRIEVSYNAIPRIGETHLNFINTLPCPINITQDFSSKTFENSTPIQYDYEFPLQGQVIQGGENYALRRSANYKHPIDITIQLDKSNSSGCSLAAGWVEAHGNIQKWSGRVIPTKDAYQSLFISINNASLTLTKLPTPDDIRKSKEGNAKLRILLKSYNPLEVNSTNSSLAESFATLGVIRLINEDGIMKALSFHPAGDSGFSFRISNTFEVEPNRYRLIAFAEAENGTIRRVEMSDWFQVNTGGSYFVGVFHDAFSNQTRTKVEILTTPNTIHMLLLLPQYVLMAWAEVLFIISAVEFSFTEAPATMKSVVQSCFHLTNAVGNAIVILSAQFQMGMATGFFIFAGAMGIDMVIFALLAMRYKYVTPDTPENRAQTQGQQDEEQMTKMQIAGKIEESRL